MDKQAIITKFDQMVTDKIAFFDYDQKIVEHNEEDLTFAFVLTSALLKKPTLNGSPAEGDGQQEKEEEQLRPGSDISTVGFEIGTIGDSHLVVVNKFSFARPHLMLVSTDGFRRQYSPLDKVDLDAAWEALSAFGSSENHVVFYNCGRDGGCSRLHKHMQLMPMPAKGFAAFLDVVDGKEPDVPFSWAYRRFDDSGSVSSADLVVTYNELLSEASDAYKASVGSSKSADAKQPDAAIPHNMVLTQRWMIVLPRRQAAINKEAGANALGMLGVIAVATQKEIDNWVKLGLRQSLKTLGVPQ
ncbi:hypothetical protein NLG97_g7502 [Lecanicillium saksenae]|uniref:Uncharacterized protein n=1 Tax=Lecanicillium saksenae TaxID=468837 RepID=A0ACC1QMR8_9HYPO|nr:hypothetical protein NLG97_g7502 [Lecanicillium saksenae]